MLSFLLFPFSEIRVKLNRWSHGRLGGGANDTLAPPPLQLWGGPWPCGPPPPSSYAPVYMHPCIWLPHNFCMTYFMKTTNISTIYIYYIYSAYIHKKINIIHKKVIYKKSCEATICRGANKILHINQITLI